MLLTEAPAASFTRCPSNLNSHNHNQHAGRPCFSLAVLTECSKSTPSYDISLLRNRASNLSGTAIPLHTDCVTLHRSTAAEPSCVRCKQCARPRDTDDNRTALYAPPTARFTKSGDAGLTSDLRSIAEAQRMSQNFAFVPRRRQRGTSKRVNVVSPVGAAHALERPSTWRGIRWRGSE
jgi:hypothetical protein